MSGRISGHIIEVLVAHGDNRARVTQNCVEVLSARITPSPTTITGAGVSQDCIEVLSAYSGAARVSGHLIEVLSADSSSIPTSPGGGGGTTSFGYVG